MTYQGYWHFIPKVVQQVSMAKLDKSLPMSNAIKTKSGIHFGREVEVLGRTIQLYDMNAITYRYHIRGTEQTDVPDWLLETLPSKSEYNPIHAFASQNKVPLFVLVDKHKAFDEESLKKIAHHFTEFFGGWMPVNECMFFDRYNIRELEVDKVDRKNLLDKVEEALLS